MNVSHEFKEATRKEIKRLRGMRTTEASQLATMLEQASRKVAEGFDIIMEVRRQAEKMGGSRDLNTKIVEARKSCQVALRKINEAKSWANARGPD